MISFAARMPKAETGSPVTLPRPGSKKPLPAGSVEAEACPPRRSQADVARSGAAEHSGAVKFVSDWLETASALTA